MKAEIQYGLKHYAKTLYAANAGQRGGHDYTLNCRNKKEAKQFAKRLGSCANESKIVLENIRHQFSTN